jgi:DNA-binding response OmpR family regulator
MADSQTIALLSNDLMFAPSVGAAASARGTSLRVATSPAELQTIAETSPLCLVIVDLATPGVDVASVVKQLRAATTSSPAIIAFGAHVHAQMLDAARDAGCDDVLTRGQFHRQMHDVIARYVGAQRP